MVAAPVTHPIGISPPLILIRILVSALLLWPILGCAGTATPAAGGSGGSSSPSPFSVGTAANIYAVQNLSSSVGSVGTVLGFTTGVSGPQSPPLQFTTILDIESIATDNSGNIFVAGYLPGYLGSGAEIIAFAPGATSASTPYRTIPISDGYAPTAMATDASGALYTVDGNGTLNVYSGSTLTRTVYGVATTISYPTAVAVDASGNVFVASSATYNVAGGLPHISVFPSSASGNATPSRNITSASNFSGLATDSAGNLYAAASVYSPPYSGSIMEYSTSASGSASPIKTISGGNTGIYIPGNLRMDATGNLYTLIQNPNTAPISYTILTFAPTASGNVVPTASTSSTSLTSASTSIALR